MVGLRRKFHRRPEIAFAEHETQREIEAELSALGLPFREVKTGVIADLCVGAPITFAFRADMDALPVT